MSEKEVVTLRARQEELTLKHEESLMIGLIYGTEHSRMCRLTYEEGVELGLLNKKLRAQGESDDPR